MSSTKASLALVGVFLAVMTMPRPEFESPAPPADIVQRESPTDVPHITVRADSDDELSQLTEALTAFSEAGLDLPDLEITFFDSPEECRDAKGRFNPNTTPWRISICTMEIASIVDHELAHAWIEANVTSAERDAFLALRDLDGWLDADVPWNQRGGEWAAVVVQQGVSGLPLPPTLSDEHRLRLEGYELLSSRPAPRLVEWIAQREVSCEDRPTPLSRDLPDGSGQTCL